MPQAVIAIFDIGKTNKKFLLFDAQLSLVHQEEEKFAEITDDDGFPCDDIKRLEQWMEQCLDKAVQNGQYQVKAVNFSTYGATLMYLDDAGKRLTPVYNYLKPMPEEVMEGFYDKWGGQEEFCRKTASPALGMLNSGLQALWIKQKKPGIYSRVKTILHFPQYLSHLFTGKQASEYTSIGCHTALWDFDHQQYHPWTLAEKLPLPQPLANETVYPVQMKNLEIPVGIGIHDSSSSLVPYFKATNDQFMLISTGTWCIFMNPFNSEPLTAEQLRKDSLCYLSIQQQQVKSSRLFLGHIHDVNVERLNRHFGTAKDFYKTVKANGNKLSAWLHKNAGRVFFQQGIPADYVDTAVNPGSFLTFDEAYHRLMYDLTDLAMESLSLVITADDQSDVVYISGGFARNEIFTRLLASRLPGKKVYTSEMDNATALGAAMVVYHSAFEKNMPAIDLGLKRIMPFGE